MSPPYDAQRLAFQTLLETQFPPLLFCAAYGSAASSQLGYSTQNEKPMIDLLFVTENTSNWHKQNLVLNSTHYSFVRHFPSVIDYLQNSAAGVYYNTLIPISMPSDEFMIKYGLISSDCLKKDLLEWTSLYVAGRMQKPLRIVKNFNTNEMVNAQIQNLKSAVETSLLLCADQNQNQNLTSLEFYKSITSLSYLGDIRNGVAENPRKVENIVLGNIRGFNVLYSPILEIVKNIELRKNEKIENSKLFVDQSNSVRAQRLSELPLTVRQMIYSFQNQNASRFWRSFNKTAASQIINLEQSKEFCFELPKRISVQQQNKLIRQSISAIVERSSRQQSIKGLFTAGFRKSVRYGVAKLMKRFRK